MVKIQFQIEGFGKDEKASFAEMRTGMTPVEADRLWGSVQFFNDEILAMTIKEDLLGIAENLFVDIPLQLEQQGIAELHFKNAIAGFSFAPDITDLNFRVTGFGKGLTSLCGVFAKDELIYQLRLCGERFSNFVLELSANEKNSVMDISFPEQDC